MAKFQELESAYVSLNEKVEKNIALMKQYIAIANSQSKGQADLATKTNAAGKATQSISALEKERIRVANQTKAVFAKSLTLQEKGTRTLLKAKIRQREEQRKLNEELKKELGVTKKSGGLFRSMTKSILAAGAAYATLGTAIRILKNIGKIVIDFSKAQSNLASILGKTKDEIRDLTEDAKKYGSITKFTAAEVSNLQTELAKLGFTQDEIRNSTKAILDLAAATNADLAAAASVAGGALRAFNLSATETERVSSVLAVATTKSGLAFDDYATILGTVGPIANKFGLEIEDTIAVLGKLRDAKFDASSAATAFRNILLKMSDPTSNLSKRFGGAATTSEELFNRLKLLRDEGVDLAEVLGLTDVRAAGAFSTMIDGVDTINDLKESITDANEELGIMVDTQLDNLKGDLDIAKSAWEGFVLSLEDGSGIISTITRATIQGLTTDLGKLTKISRGLNVAIGEELIKTYESYVETLRETRTEEETLEILLKAKEIQSEKIAKNTERLGKVNRITQAELEKENKLREQNILAINSVISSVQSEIQASEDAETAKIKAAEEAVRIKKELKQKELDDLAKLQAKIDEEVYQERLTAFQKFKKKREEEESKADQASIERQKAHLEEQLELLQQAAENEIALAQKVAEEEEAIRVKKLEDTAMALDFIGSAAQELFSLQQSFADSEIANIERQRDAEIAAAKKSGKDTVAIEAKYAKKEAKLRTDQAKKEKQQALFTAGIKTAQAIVAAAAIGPPQNIPFIAFAAALGAIQIAAIAAKPIPKFKHGTDGKLQLDTTAIVGDEPGYKPELISTPQGDFMSPGTDTLVHLPKGSQVFKHDSPETQAALNGGMTPEQYQGLINEQRLTRKAIQNQTHIIPTKDYMLEVNKKTGLRKKYLDNFI